MPAAPSLQRPAPGCNDVVVERLAAWARIFADVYGRAPQTDAELDAFSLAYNEGFRAGALSERRATEQASR